MVSERWVQTLRDSVADAGLADGWSVMNRNGNVQVQHSWLEPGGSRQKATAKLPVVWEKGCTADVISALTVVQKAMLQGRTLKEAVKVIGKQTTLANGGLDWDAAWEQFKCSKIESGQVSDEGGFTRAYGSCWKFLRVAIEEQSPQNASHLLLYSTYSAEKDADGKWIPLLQGSPYRCRKVQIVKVFLEFCCNELGFEER